MTSVDRQIQKLRLRQRKIAEKLSDTPEYTLKDHMRVCDCLEIEEEITRLKAKSGGKR